MKAFLTDGAVRLLDNKMCNPADFQRFTQDLVCHLLKLSIFTESVAPFVQKEAENVAASEAKTRKDISREIITKKRRAARSPLRDRSSE